MLLRNRTPGIDSAPISAASGYEHVSAPSIAVVRWLNACGIDFVLVGAVARAIRGDRQARGPVSVVPAPYGRNLERLARSLTAAHARLRAQSPVVGPISATGEPAPLKLAAEQLHGPLRWAIQCGGHELDVEGRPTGAPSYQELLFEAVGFEIAEGVAAETASPEHIELFDHVGRTGRVPEITVARAAHLNAG